MNFISFYSSTHSTSLFHVVLTCGKSQEIEKHHMWDKKMSFNFKLHVKQKAKGSSPLWEVN